MISQGLPRDVGLVAILSSRLILAFLRGSRLAGPSNVCSAHLCVKLWAWCSRLVLGRAQLQHGVPSSRCTTLVVGTDAALRCVKPLLSASISPPGVLARRDEGLSLAPRYRRMARFGVISTVATDAAYQLLRRYQAEQLGQHRCVTCPVVVDFDGTACCRGIIKHRRVMPSFTIHFDDSDTTPDRLRDRALELGIPVDVLIQRAVSEHLGVHCLRQVGTDKQPHNLNELFQMHGFLKSTSD